MKWVVVREQEHLGSGVWYWVVPKNPIIKNLKLFFHLTDYPFVPFKNFEEAKEWADRLTNEGWKNKHTVYQGRKK